MSIITNIRIRPTMAGPRCTPITLRNFFSSSRQARTADGKTKIHMVGGTEYDDLKQFRLVQLPTILDPQPKTLASLCVKRNIIFGARIHYVLQQQKQQQQQQVEGQDESASAPASNNMGKGLVKTCLPLLRRALGEASAEGDQPQGLAALNGLSAYVRHAMQTPGFSPALEKMRSAAVAVESMGNSDAALSSEHDGEREMVLDAIRAVATHIPRQGHKVVGIGTYTDAKDGWTKLAKEYSQIVRSKENELAILEGEAQLFRKVGGTFVNVEYIGVQENPEYWVDAGGAMARFFFL